MKIKSLLVALTLLVALVSNAGEAKYIFYYIGDGMGLGPVMATETYNRMTRQGQQQLLMTSLPVASWVQTWSASSPVTDSAAAGTALSTASKTKNGMLGMNADTVSVTSIAKILHDDGYGIGIVTNVAADDATPGAFYAHQPKRSMFYEIGRDAADSGYDFIAGAGLRGTKHKDGTDNGLYDYIEQSGVKILRGQQGAKAVYTNEFKRIMLINPDGVSDPNEMGYAIDRNPLDTVGLTLQIATEACMSHLLRNSPDAFFMMVEGGQIDHALHGNDGATAIRELLEFDQTLRLAYEFYLEHPDETLIVVTADHDTGALSVGCKATGYAAYTDNVDAQHISKGQLSDLFDAMLRSRRIYTWDDMRDILREKMGFWDQVKIKPEQEQALRDEFDRTFIDRAGTDEAGLYKTVGSLATLVFKVYSDATGFGFTTFNHSGNPVPVFAVGVGSEAFNHVLNNTDLPNLILKAAGK